MIWHGYYKRNGVSMLLFPQDLKIELNLFPLKHKFVDNH